ncbi:hypothetical protein ACFYRN_39810 [Streptomyces sp. NPDC005227]|uniref:hypothetical protein n=1 Tax=Streptomyces sp. NPDC005227 TaxID=3364707 RepID=UPI0036A14526
MITQGVRVSGRCAACGGQTIRHPEIGDVLLDCDLLIVPGADLRMVTCTAATGSSDAGKLGLLRVTGGRTATALP